MATYILPFDPTGRDLTRITVPAGKKLYLVRAEALSEGTATVHDVTTLDEYKLNDGVTICGTNIPPESEVALVFIARSNAQIHSLNVEVISPRAGLPACAS